MRIYLRGLFKGWRWSDYFQFIHSAAFSVFGALILMRVGSRMSFAGYLIGGSFLLFGLYRLKFFVSWFNKAHQEIKRSFPVQ
ncbi:MAG: hypothetical protein HYR81_02725 [Nitrospirae bacterium]|nr:hypothetical protein [Nitrospirota bacterium]